MQPSKSQLSSMSAFHRKLARAYAANGQQEKAQQAAKAAERVDEKAKEAK